MSVPTRHRRLRPKCVAWSDRAKGVRGEAEAVHERSSRHFARCDAARTGRNAPDRKARRRHRAQAGVARAAQRAPRAVTNTIRLLGQCRRRDRRPRRYGLRHAAVGLFEPLRSAGRLVGTMALPGDVRRARGHANIRGLCYKASHAGGRPMKLADPTLLKSQCLIDGAWVGEGVDAIKNPATGALIAKIPRFGHAETVLAI